MNTQKKGTTEAPMTPARKEHHAIPDWGVDKRPQDRPGVPKETPPHPVAGAHWREPERQPEAVTVVKRATLKRLTPVFSTAVPPHGLSGAIRRFAYRIPEHLVRHWLLLLVADRVDVVESKLHLPRPVIAVVRAARALSCQRRTP